MENKKELKSLSPLRLTEKFKETYKIKNFIDQIFVITSDPNYYYYCISTSSDQRLQLPNGFWIEPDRALDQKDQNANFGCYYFLDLNAIYRIKKNELEKYIAQESDLVMHWDTQLEVVMRIDELVNNHNKIHIVVIDEQEKNILNLC